MQRRYNEYVNLVQYIYIYIYIYMYIYIYIYVYVYKNYWNNSEKPQQNTTKNHCEKELGNATAKLKQKTIYCQLQNVYKNMVKLTKNMQKVCKTQLKMGYSIFYPQQQGVWTTKFPGENDCLTHKSPGIESFLLIWLSPQKKMIPEENYQSPTPKKVSVQIYPLEKYTLK